MAQRLNAHYIAQIYTLEQIDAKIASTQEKLENAVSGGYSLDTTQGKQTVNTPTDITSIESLLAVYLKARMVKTGDYEGTRIISGGYAP